jgi:hypothetical protein
MPAVWQYAGGDPVEPVVGDGSWEQVVFRRPYAKYNGVWTACKSYYAKVGGTWVQQWAYDTTPPAPPQLDLILVENLDNQGKVSSRWIRVGVRQSMPSHDPTIPVIRVLTDYNDKAPTTPLGGTYTSTPDQDYPGEPWSDWRFDGTVYGTAAPHADNSKIVYKQWPLNANTGTLLKGDRNYHFGAWAMDENGNWSAGTQGHIDIPKGGVDEPRTIVKEATFVPNAAGSWKKNQWEAGNLVQQKSPRSQGLWLYGGQIRDNLTPNSRITSQQIWIARGSDSGSANANIYLFHHPYGHTYALPAVGSAIETNQDTFIGTLAKGQGKWFTIPDKFRDNFKDGSAKGVGLAWKSPDRADAVAADYSVCYWNGGSIHMVWEEDV